MNPGWTICGFGWGKSQSVDRPPIHGSKLLRSAQRPPSTNRAIKRSLSISPEAQEALLAYHWPGNVRELQNCIERAVILAEGDTIQPRHLNLSFVQASADEPVADPWESFDFSGTLQDVARRGAAEAERRKLQHALAASEGDRLRAAEALGITYKALTSKLKEHRLD